MGWKISIACGGPINPDLLDSFLPGYGHTGESTDFYTACDCDGYAAGILPNGMAVIVGEVSDFDLSSVAIELSMRGKSGEFHMHSTTSYYEYRVYEYGRITSQGMTEDGESPEPDYGDTDDALGLLDEEDGLGSSKLTEDGLWELFEKILSADDPNWKASISMRLYRKIEH